MRYLLLMLVGGLIVAGIFHAGQRYERSTWNERVRESERLYSGDLARQNAKNSDLEAKIAHLTEHAARMARENEDAIRKLTSGRACLSAAAVAVVNRVPDGAAQRAGEAPGTTRAADAVPAGVAAAGADTDERRRE